MVWFEGENNNMKTSLSPWTNNEMYLFLGKHKNMLN